MLSNEQLQQLKQILLDEHNHLDSQLQGNKEGSLEGRNARDTVGELSLYDNHPADMGSELFEREKDFALEEHADSELGKINDALKAMEDGNYGKCKTCGKDIPYERLEAVPATLYCIEHTPEQVLRSGRPVEEDVLEPAHGNTFQHLHNTELGDFQDSFQEVARYGTSETPSDLRGDYEDYNSLYNEGHNDEGFTEDYEAFTGNEIDSSEKKVYPSKKHEEYEKALAVENIEAPFGHVHYHETDGYVSDEHDEKGNTTIDYFGEEEEK